MTVFPIPFYRLGPYEPLDPTAIIATKEVRKALDPFLASTDNRRAAQDAASFLAHLDSRSDIVGNQVGTTGYCMSGAIALTVATTYRTALLRRPAFTVVRWPPTPTSARTWSSKTSRAACTSAPPTTTPLIHRRWLDDDRLTNLRGARR